MPVTRARLLAAPAPRAEWRALLAADPEALPYQTPGWTDAVVATSGGRDASRLYELPSGLRAVLPAVARPGAPLARRVGVLSSQPYGWGMGGLVVPARDLDPADVAAVFADLAASGGVLTALRPAPRRAASYRAAALPGVLRVAHTAHVLDLAGGFDAVWRDRATGKARRAVRKAEAAGVTVEVDATGRLVPVFDALYRQSVRRWAEQSHEPLWLARLRSQRSDPERKFAAVATALGAACRVRVACLAGRPVAAIITLHSPGHVAYWRGAMDKEAAGPVRANDLLHRTVIEAAAAEGAGHYHLGESAPGSGLARFKESLGAEPVAYEGYRLERLPLTRADAAVRGLVKRALRSGDRPAPAPG
ncbi:GNAT family N-acetyltransferase [Blastococcus xanthinilyticus]|uniref:CelD/BcsL family acetyltransferase involved in cellulose biosynthesis n=1 Tax=Blastococcus xanthinilyticus TaxID=1564164 RepID=A0A5S5CU18_9ACTN|nr:GNAT family N-acetyltransferase [Blastococcus xanthinilyticus]TYP87213.1 CelD/BcsL family acetyltransferase involved in cellulose biosynthesis [Blastococcus xanthinilyticus]